MFVRLSVLLLLVASSVLGSHQNVLLAKINFSLYFFIILFCAEPEACRRFLLISIKDFSVTFFSSGLIRLGMVF